ncbi:MAG: hypothetical protein QOF21_3028 [Actinomycetota bacterium]|jgi:hypothetical protein
MSETNDPIAPTDTPAARPPVDPITRLLASVGIGLAALALAELVGTIVIGLAVKVDKMSFLARQGYGFLTQLEKSPVGIMLVVASIAAAVAVMRADREGTEEALGRYAAWLVIVAGVLLGIGTILGVLARFRVADLVAAQPVDAITRRVLVIFVIRNFGTAVVAILVAVGVAFARVRPSRVG